VRGFLGESETRHYQRENFLKLLTWNVDDDSVTMGERVSSIARKTLTMSSVVNSSTLCINPASTHTWVITSNLLEAETIAGTVRIYQTDRSATDIRITQIVWRTRARASIPIWSAYRVFTTRRWLTRMFSFWWWFWSTMCKSVPSISSRTGANW